MPDTPTEKEIVEGASEHGIARYLMGLRNARTLSSNRDFIRTVAGLTSRRSIRLQGQTDDVFLAGMDRQEYFAGMRLLCTVIPELRVGHRELMAVVETLVKYGGNDLAANEPNAAFRQWCAADARRVDEVLKDSRAGDHRAVGLLCFALEAGKRVDEAIGFLTSKSVEAAAGAALALGRMALTRSDAVRSVGAISLAAREADDDSFLQQAVLACFEILARHDGLCRSDARAVLGRAERFGSDGTRHALATLLARHGGDMTNEEIDLALAALKNVDPERGGTVEEIDLAAPRLVARGYFDGLMDVVSVLIRGGVTFDSLVRVWEELVRGDGSRLQDQAVSWLLDGEPRICFALTDRLGRFHKRPPIFDLDASMLPERPEEQLFLCRKAVGFLFVLPTTAASVLVSVLKRGDTSVADDVGALLHALLQNYSGDLRAYLEDDAGAHADSAGTVIAEALKRAEGTASVDGLEPLPEVFPSEERRQMAHVHEVRTMADAVREGSRTSVFAGVMRHEHLGYGRSVSTYVNDASESDAGWRRVEVPMRSLSVSTELPRLSVLDPEGLEQLLWELRMEKRKTK